MKKIIALLSACLLISAKGVIYEMDLKKNKEGHEVQFSRKGDILLKTPLKK